MSQVRALLKRPENVAHLAGRDGLGCRSALDGEGLTPLRRGVKNKGGPREVSPWRISVPQVATREWGGSALLKRPENVAHLGIPDGPRSGCRFALDGERTAQLRNGVKKTDLWRPLDGVSANIETRDRGGSERC